LSGEIKSGSGPFVSLSTAIEKDSHAAVRLLIAIEKDSIAKESDSDTSETLLIAIERRIEETASLNPAIDCRKDRSDGFSFATHSGTKVAERFALEIE